MDQSAIEGRVQRAKNTEQNGSVDRCKRSQRSWGQQEMDMGSMARDMRLRDRTTSGRRWDQELMLVALRMQRVV